MDAEQIKYYHEMVNRDRAYMITNDGHLVAAVMFFIGSNDNKYLYGRDPWTILDDEPDGDTVYIDQLLTTRNTTPFIHKKFKEMLNDIQERFKNVKQAKWVRAPANFRKHKIREGRPNVHCKNLKRGRL